MKAKYKAGDVVTLNRNPFGEDPGEFGFEEGKTKMTIVKPIWIGGTTHYTATWQKPGRRERSEIIILESWIQKQK